MIPPCSCRIVVDLNKNIRLKILTDAMMRIFPKNVLKSIPSFIKWFHFTLSNYGYVMLQLRYLRRWKNFLQIFLSKSFQVMILAIDYESNHSCTLSCRVCGNNLNLLVSSEIFWYLKCWQVSKNQETCVWILNNT